jgi:hypothetical protein
MFLCCIATRLSTMEQFLSLDNSNNSDCDDDFCTSEPKEDMKSHLKHWNQFCQRFFCLMLVPTHKQTGRGNGSTNDKNIVGPMNGSILVLANRDQSRYRWIQRFCQGSSHAGCILMSPTTKVQRIASETLSRVGSGYILQPFSFLDFVFTSITIMKT